MCKIFHCLQYSNQFDGDLFECSLVNSHWLYRVWDINYTPDNNALHPSLLQ